MNRSPLEELTKEELIRIVQGEAISKVVMERAAHQKTQGQKISKEDTNKLLEMLKKMIKTTNFPGLTWGSALAALCLVFVVSLSARVPGNDIHLVYTGFAILITAYTFNATFRVNDVNTKLEALIALLSKSNAI